MADLTKGTILENTYEIIEEIGSGGGGVVFRAWHLRLQTDVVVKKIRDEVRTKVKSRQEADILKRLKHPYLPRVYDFMDTEDGVFTVMDFVHGENLDDAVKQNGKYGQKQVRKWAEQLGEALAYLHSQKPPIIHSDIKPANIMLMEEGDICLIDFNISLAMGGSLESVVGISAGFSPPEQYRDPALYTRITHNYAMQKAAEETEKTEVLLKTEILVKDEADRGTGKKTGKTAVTKKAAAEYIQYIGKGIDARSDIYSLGMTLYFLLTGEAPSTDFGQRTPVYERDPAISEGFALILDKMMELAPEKRYQDGREFLKAVRNCYKLDSRYVAMHRKQAGIQAAALAILGLGIVTVFGGIKQMDKEKNSAYYSFIQQAQEAMAWEDYEKADHLLERAKEIARTRIEAYREEVYLLYLNEEYEECIKTGENYINTLPFQVESEEEKEQFGDIHYMVGNAYFEKEDYSNAEILLRRALEYNSRNGLYYRDHAIILAKLGQLVEAEKELETGIELGMAQDSVYMAQGEIAHVKGEYEEAAECFEQTITVTDDIQMKKRAVLLCTAAYKDMGSDGVDREIALLEQYRGQFEGNGYLVMSEYLAEGYVRKARIDETMAEECYRKALDLFLSIYEKGYVTYQLQENMAILYENMDAFDESERVLQSMKESYPERYEVYKRLAYLEADRQQEKENAERDYGQMEIYYKKAEEMYTGKGQDMEMDMLEQMIEELKEGGWL